ncbi:MAG: hypothetical protein DI533_00490 [Cereibacter sphaeroides]|uniref:Uncharacterized protein n=1 Tax=Cereibacter sphaeroides TaxID=1063 RepID=A0A2W5UMX1_CERSP|nr:MAG: hypothetical protein DI533_00490 [Cereibacter sphaeroides]
MHRFNLPKFVGQLSGLSLGQPFGLAYPTRLSSPSLVHNGAGSFTITPGTYQDQAILPVTLEWNLFINGVIAGPVDVNFTNTTTGVTFSIVETARAPNLTPRATLSNEVVVAVYVPQWIVADTYFIDETPIPANSPLPTVVNTNLTGVVGSLGQVGTYEIKNVTQNGEVNLSVDAAMPIDLLQYGEPGDVFEIVYIGFDAAGPTINLPAFAEKILDLVATPGDGQVTLTHSAPASASGITDYIYERNSGAGFVVISDGTSATPGYVDTGRTNGVLLSYRVSTVNASGASEPSDPVFATPEAAITPVVIAAFDHGESTANATSYTFSARVTATGDAVVAVFTDAGVNGGPSSVTIGGAAMTLLYEKAYNSNIIIRVYTKSGITGTSNTVVVNCTATMDRCGIVVWSLQNANIAAAAANGATGAANATPGTSVNATAGGALLTYFGSKGQTSGSLTSGVTLPQRLALTLIESTTRHMAGDEISATSETPHIVTSSYNAGNISIRVVVAVPKA